MSFLGGGVVGSNYRAWFTLDDGKGIAKTGVAGSTTFTVVAADDSASTAPTVTESTQSPGTYFADVPGAFLTTHGAGNYAIQISVTATSPKYDAVVGRFLRVTVDDVDTLAISLDLIRKVHTNRLEASPGDPGTLILYDDDGTTPLRTWSMRDYLGNAVTGVAGSPALRGAAT